MGQAEEKPTEFNFNDWRDNAQPNIGVVAGKFTRLKESLTWVGTRFGKWAVKTAGGPDKGKPDVEDRG